MQIFSVENGLSAFFLSPFHGYDFNSFNQFEKFKFIAEKLSIAPEISEELKLINEFKNLEVLSLPHEYNTQEIFLSNFAKLRKLMVSLKNSNVSFKGISQAVEFISLSDLTNARLQKIVGIKLPNLKSLILNSGNIESLQNFEDLTSIEYLSLNYLSKLSDISALNSFSKLSELEIDNCKFIDYESIGNEMSSVKRLKLNFCGKVENLEYLLKLFPKLVYLEFYETIILSGDLSILLNSSIDYHFNNKKHYNVKSL